MFDKRIVWIRRVTDSVSELVVDVLKPIDPWMTSTEINDDYERYLADEYDNIELRFFDTSEVSDSGDITESDRSSISDSATEFEAESLLDGSSLEHANVQQLDAPKFDLFGVLKLFYSEKNAYNLSAPFPNDEPDLVPIYESADIPELSCFVHSSTHSEFESTTDLFLELFYAKKKSSELSAAFINHEQDAQVDFESYFT
ncbi:hypothetical protein B0H14DRAFT_3694723 [Mycena olivaceomarginata]|nr:hypothetical protein B0H14DRAFT_3694723 [Mycena olivaceomarginata]